MERCAPALKKAAVERSPPGFMLPAEAEEGIDLGLGLGADAALSGFFCASLFFQIAIEFRESQG